MRHYLLPVFLVALAGCSSAGYEHYSPYDLNRDGVMDARCPGLAYDVTANTLYGWRSKGSAECEKQAPMSEGES